MARGDGTKGIENEMINETATKALITKNAVRHAQKVLAEHASNSAPQMITIRKSVEKAEQESNWDVIHSEQFWVAPGFGQLPFSLTTLGQNYICS